MTVYPQWKDLVDRYGLVASQARPEWGESQEQLGLKTEIDTVAAKINSYLGELERSEEHTSELQSQSNLVCRLLLEKKKKKEKHLSSHNKTTKNVLTRNC